MAVRSPTRGWSMDRYETIRKQHEELTHRLDRLYLIASSRPGMLPQGRVHALLEREIASIHAMLAAHFALEEADGYLVELTRSNPSLNLRVTDLAQQHADFIVRCEHIASTLAAGGNDETIKADVRRLIDDLEQHEHAEVDILEAAPLDDVARSA